MDFQTIVHDGFFRSPDKVREWALTLDYSHPDGTFPGVRTRCTKFIHKKFYESTCSKLMSLWGNYDIKDCNLQLHFQKIKRFNADPDMNVGWIHQDIGAKAAAVIYLDPNAELNQGTSHYRVRSNIAEIDAVEFPKNAKGEDQRWIYKKVLGEEQSRDPEDLRLYYQNMRTHNDMFETILDVKNVYNRVIGYAGDQWHGQTSFYMDNDDDFRLTIVAFVISAKSATRRFELKSRYI